MSTILNLLSIVLAVLAVGLAYAIATDPREPVGRLPGSTRFGTFLVVAGGAGLLFRYLLSMISPFLTGSTTIDSILNFIVGLILSVFIVWFYLHLGENPRTLISRLPGIGHEQAGTIDCAS
jgi:hypothetical protein